MKYALKIGAKAYTVEVGDMIAGQVKVAVNGKSFDVVVEEGAPAAPQARSAAPVQQAAAKTPAVARPTAAVAESGVVLAPIPGLILAIKVNVGDAVEPGQCVAIMEAMKMENDLTAPLAGIVQEIMVQKGAEVSTGQAIMRIE
jgi:glutaconyl-CoA/methylmalonyl-CoA decarboxylase subunit gamma